MMLYLNIYCHLFQGLFHSHIYLIMYLPIYLFNFESNSVPYLFSYDGFVKRLVKLRSIVRWILQYILAFDAFGN